MDKFKTYFFCDLAGRRKQWIITVIKNISHYEGDNFTFDFPMMIFWLHHTNFGQNLLSINIKLLKVNMNLFC